MAARIQELEPDIYRLRVRSPGGLVANIYAFRHGKELALFDLGFPFTTDDVEAELAKLDATFADVTRVFYTHTHIDHLGGGAALGDKLTATQYIWSGTPEEATSAYFAWYTRHQAPGDAFEELLPPTKQRDTVVASMRAQPEGDYGSNPGTLANLVRVDFGETVEFGRFRFRCVDLRGHDPYHCGWVEETTQTIVSGDAAMRVITPIMPNMGDQLFPWLAAIERLRGLGLQRLLPGHGLPTTLVAESLDRSERFVQAIYELADDALADGIPVDPLDIAMEYLGQDRTKYSVRLAVFVGTTYAVLDGLASLGLATKLPSRHWVQSRTLPSYAEFRKRALANAEVIAT